MKRRYTIIVFTENNFGLLNRITIIFSRRRINIESLTVSETERKGISRYTIVIEYYEDKIKPLIKQIRKIIGTLIVFHNEDDEIFYSQIAFLKVSTPTLEEREKVISFVQTHNARISFSTSEYVVVEKTGNEDDIFTMLQLMEPFGVIEFVKSGRIAVVKDQARFSKYAKNLDPEGWYSQDEFHMDLHTNGKH